MGSTKRSKRLTRIRMARLAPELDAALEAVARETGQSVSAILRMGAAAAVRYYRSRLPTGGIP
jgi:hypothetical protein